VRERGALFEAIYAASPWPMLMIGSEGELLGASDDRNAAAPAAGDDLPLRDRARHYLGLLRGAVPWLTPQVVDTERVRPSGAPVHERLHLRRTEWGASLAVIDRSELHAQQPGDAQTARLAALGFMVAGVCHEVTNPLTSLHSIVQILRSERQPSQELLDKGLNNIAVNVKRILDISRRLVTFSRVGDEPRVRFAVDEAVEEALYVVRHEGLMQHVELQRQADAGAIVFGSIGQAREIFLNLLVNAVQAMDGRGTLQVATRRVGDKVEVTVADSGTGVPEALRSRIFEPFFTTKGETRGTGLGLAISNEIALEHGGSIELRDAAGRGASFCVVLPRATA
jgi:two-component system, NtrC family, sensor kinase